ncbi:MAG: hypothetical protein RI973_1344 [Bacteroidota bacterium]|jgi:drug/metabolite transporter (DMT)-like permease
MKQTAKEKWAIPLAFFTIYTVWGSTYLASWYVLQDIPPLLTAGSRLFSAGIILYALSLFYGNPRVTLGQCKNAAISGIMFLTIGTGGMVCAAQYIASSMLALMVAFQPLLILLLMWQMDGKKPTLKGLLGTALGMTGMAFLVLQDQFISNENTLIGIACVLVSLLSWGTASVRIAKMDMPTSKLQSSGIQMLVGGGILLIASLGTGEMNELQISDLSERAVWSWLYLVIFGSVIAFSAFNFLLIASTPEKVATSNYVNPVVAMLLGWGLNNEHISGQSFLASILLISGVIVINTRFSALKSLSFVRNTG